MTRFRFLIVNAILLIVLAGTYWSRGIDNGRVSNSECLNELRLPFRDWKSVDTQLTRDELNLLDPDAVIVRTYSSPKATEAYMELAVIAGHKKKTVHSPGFCMAGGGWEIVSQKPCTIKLNQLDVPAVRAVLTRGEEQLVATYFYSNGTYHTDSLPAFMVAQLMGRLQSRIPIGALVRIITPVVSDQRGAEDLTSEFARAVLPGILSSLKSAHVELAAN